MKTTAFINDVICNESQKSCTFVKDYHCYQGKRRRRRSSFFPFKSGASQHRISLGCHTHNTQISHAMIAISLSYSQQLLLTLLSHLSHSISQPSRLYGQSCSPGVPSPSSLSSWKLSSMVYESQLVAPEIMYICASLSLLPRQGSKTSDLLQTLIPLSGKHSSARITLRCHTHNTPISHSMIAIILRYSQQLQLTRLQLLSHHSIPQPSWGTILSRPSISFNDSNSTAGIWM